MSILPSLKQNKKSSREQIAIQGVRDGILELPGNRYRAVLEALPINFALKSDEEQEIIIDNYQTLLDSLSMPVQVLVRARTIDMKQYTATWEERRQAEKNPVYKKQIEDYSNFVNELVENNSILTRRFFVIIPATTPPKEKEWPLIRQSLEINCGIVTEGLKRVGVTTKALNDLEVMDLFYSFYNPRRAKLQPLANLVQNIVAEAS